MGYGRDPYESDDDNHEIGDARASFGRQNAGETHETEDCKKDNDGG